MNHLQDINKDDDKYLDFAPRMGMYSIYLKDWYCIFPKQQIHVLRTEDLASSPERELKKIFNFLELGLSSIVSWYILVYIMIYILIYINIYIYI